MRWRLCVLVLLGAMVACEDSTGRRLAEEDFVELTDAICARSRRKTRAVDGPREESLKEIARVLDETLPIQEAALDELEEIDPPDDLERDLRRYIAGLRASLADLEDAQEAAADDDRAEYEDAEARARKRFPEIQERARDLGLRICSDGGSE